MFFNLTISCKSLILSCTRQESNLRPTESESVTLSNWATGAYGGTDQSCFHQFSVSFTCFQYSNFYHLFHLVFCFHSLAIIFVSLPDWLALILRTATEFIRKTDKTTILSNRFIGLQFLLCKAEGFEKNYVMICYACNCAMIFQACTSGNSFQQVVKAGLLNLLRALQSELPETEAEATV